MLADPQSRIAVSIWNLLAGILRVLQSISVLLNSNYECCAAFGICRPAIANAAKHLAFINDICEMVRSIWLCHITIVKEAEHLGFAGQQL